MLYICRVKVQKYSVNDGLSDVNKKNLSAIILAFK